MDPLIHGLERYGKGYKVAGHSVTTLAFADDLVLIGGSWSEMAHNLLILDEFCQNTCLRVNPRKCHSFLVRPCDHSFVVNDCAPWVLGGKALNQTSLADTRVVLQNQYAIPPYTPTPGWDNQEICEEVAASSTVYLWRATLRKEPGWRPGDLQAPSTNPNRSSEETV
ncbi:unnamed protein product [Leuciscus chuanchicus]